MSRLIDANLLKEDFPLDDHTEYDTEGIQYIIDSAPTINAVPVVHGYWKCGRHGGFQCSVCDEDDVSNFTNYCPNCGAKMDESMGYACLD